MSSKSTRFKIVIPVYNAYPWIEKCLESIEKQTYRNFDVCIIDDTSTQEEMCPIIEKYAERNGWLAIFNETNQKALANIVKGVDKLDCNDEDVIIFMDGDDWLISAHVLEKLDKIYSTEDVWMTYGQYQPTSLDRPGACAPIGFWERFTRSYRKQRWKFSHLRSAKYFLWKNIDDKDLRNPEGNYFPCTYDLAIMFPMAEMAGKHIRFVPEVMYVYNDTTGMNVHNLRAQLQCDNEKIIRSRDKYKKLAKAP